MSQFYDQASLVMVPSGYKAGKVYSQKPLSTDGELTFTRNSNATRIGPDGKLERVRTNYCRYSQDFGSWSKFGSVTRTTGVTDPNGGTTAATIANIPSGNFTDGIMLANNPMTIGSEPIIGSVWLKGSGTIGLALERSVSGDYFFYQKLVTLTSTWTRYNIRGSSGGSRAGFTFYIANKTDSTATSVDVAFAQTEYGDIETDYIATTSAAVSVGATANVPRLDYTPTLGQSGGDGCPSLLLEPQRTNLALWSESFDNAAWLKFDLNVTANQTASPTGYVDADLITTTAINDALQQNFSAVNGTSYTLSTFLKSGTADTISLVVFGAFSTSVGTYNLTNKTATSGAGSPIVSIQDYGSGWFRVTLTTTATSTGTGSFYFASSSTSAVSTYYLWGAQCEAGSYASNYIPTLGASVTRLADAAYKTGISSLIGQTEGTIFLEVERDAGVGFENLLFLGDGGLDNFVNVIYDNSVNRYKGQVRSAGTTDGVVTAQSAYTGKLKIAVAYAANDLVLYINGVLQQTDTSVTLPSNTLSVMGVGSYYNTAYGPDMFRGDFHQMLLFKTRLSNADLETLTTL